MPTKILIVDDDPKVRRFLERNLVQEGYKVVEAENGEMAIGQVTRESPDIIILDVTMPVLDGIEVCRWVRKTRDTPIIVLSGIDDEMSKVRALDEGADDYLVKPLGRNELLARVRAVSRRILVNAAAEISRVDIDDLVIDFDARRVFVDGVDIRLTRTEFALMTILARNLNEVVSHDELLGQVWGPEYHGSSHYLHVYLGRVRKKLGEHYSQLLDTVSGVGYILRST